MDVYSIMLSCMMLLFSYWFNQHYVNIELEKYEDKSTDIMDILHANPQWLFVNVLVQIMMALCYNLSHLDLPSSQSHPYVHWWMKRFTTAIYLCLLQPVLWRLLVMPPHYLTYLPLICSLLIVVDLVTSLLVNAPTVIRWFKSTYTTTRHMLRTFGIQVYLETQWVRLHVPIVLRVFWLTRLAYQLTQTTTVMVLANAEAENDFYITSSNVTHISQSVLVAGCETFVALLGMTSVVSFITHYIGVIMAAFVGSDNDDDKNMGTVSAILFFILALQTGLTGLGPDKRVVRLYRNFCLLSTAILHFVHSMVNPLLMNLSASRNPSYVRHGRPLAMCAFLVSFPCWFLYYLWSEHVISTWLLAVTAFSVEVIIKVVITLLLYYLFMIDAWRETFWEKLDDYVYYIKSTGNTIEFLFGIFLFGNGAWIMVFESGGTIRAVMMCIHAYFNIWVQAKEGWKVFMKRRTAVNKINSLPEATQDELHSHNDVCAICYQELTTARITHCRHLFHGVCLRKWLYVQDRCPLCHKYIYRTEDGSTDNDPNGDPNRDVPPELQVNGQALHDHLE